MKPRHATLPAVIAAVFAATNPAFASAATVELTRMTGTITDVAIAPPHPALTMKTSEGEVWTVDLGDTVQTRRSGLDADAGQPGDAVVILGNRSQDRSEKRIAAVRITIGGQTYDLDPERIPASAD